MLKRGEGCLSEKEILTVFGILLLCSLILACILGSWGLIGFICILYQFALSVGIGLAVSIPCLVIWNLMVSRFGYEKACVIASIRYCIHNFNTNSYDNNGHYYLNIDLSFSLIFSSISLNRSLIRNPKK